MFFALSPSDHVCYHVLCSKSIFLCPWFCIYVLFYAFQLIFLVLQSLVAQPRSGLFYSFASKASFLNAVILASCSFSAIDGEVVSLASQSRIPSSIFLHGKNKTEVDIYMEQSHILLTIKLNYFFHSATLFSFCVL